MKAIDLFKKQVINKRLSSSYIFCGSDLNLIEENINFISRELSISKFAVFEVIPEKLGKNLKLEIKVSAIRDLIRKINLTPAIGGIKLAIIRDADLMNLEAANTLLKTLEEPPKNSVIILISKNMKLLPTIISRCQVFKFPDIKSSAENVLVKCLENDGRNLSAVFDQIEKVVAKDDLVELFEPLILEYRNRLISLPKTEIVEKIKKIFEAKQDIAFTTNKRLVIENLYLALNM